MAAAAQCAAVTSGVATVRRSTPSCAPSAALAPRHSFAAGAALRIKRSSAPAARRLPRQLFAAAAAAAAPSADYRTRAPADVRVLVVGATGYIGKFVVKELVKRGYNVVAFARERSGIGGKQSAEDVKKELAGADVRFGDVMSQESLSRVAFSEKVDVVVSCLASRTGGIKDSWDVDYQATLNSMEAGRKAGASHFVLLSAICVQKPTLEFQRAKLAFEEKLQKAGDITYSIVRPTAFFKSLAGQVELVKDGKPYVMFGDGTLAACKPISEADLAAFIADCVTEKDKVNQVLPIGGPGKALTALDQAQLLFDAAGVKPFLFPVPVSLMDGIIGLLDLVTKVVPGAKDAAEFGKIGKYYAVESMLVWDPVEGKYLPDATPSYGKDTLEDFFKKAVKEGLKGQELGDQAVFGVNKEPFGRGTGSSEETNQEPMFRPSKSKPALEPRYSDPLEGGESAGVVEWEHEPILNLVTAVLGAGVLGFPFCFRVCGLGLAVLLVLVTLAAAELSMRLLLIASQLTGRRSYEELARHVFGRPGQFAVDSCVVAMNVGSVVAYLNILTDTVSTVAGTVIPPGAEPSRNMMLGLVALGGCLPVALFVRSPQLLAAVNSVSMVFLLFFCCILAMLPFSPTPNTGILAWWRWEGVLVAFPIVSYGFTAHQYLFQIYPASQRPSMRKMTTAVQRGMLLSAAIYVAVGAGGYTAFGTRTSGDVLRNLGGMGAHGMRLTAERVLKYGFGLSLLGVIPLTVIPLHNTFAPWLALCSPAYRAAAAKQVDAGVSVPPAAVLSPLQGSLLTTAILGGSCALAVALPNVEYVFGLAGSTASTLLAFILPAAIFLSVTTGQRGMLGASVDMLRGTNAWRQRRRMAGALLLFGCLAGVLCTQALVVSIREEHEVVQLAQELVREETKVAVAAQTEAKAKAMAEAVATVVQAAQEVDAAQEEAAGQAQKLMVAAQALNTTGNGKKQQRKKTKEATSELAAVHSGVDKAVQKLENVTATLGATASRMRNETKAAAAAAAAVAAGDAAGGSEGAAAVQQQQQLAAKDQGQQQQAAMQQHQHMETQQQEQQTQAQQKKQQQPTAQGTDQQGQEQQHAGGGAGGAADAAGSTAATNSSSSTGSSSNTTSSSSAGSAAHTGVVRAAEAAISKFHSAVRKDTPPRGNNKSGGGSDDVAEALEKVASTANDTLTAVRQSQAALEAAAADAAALPQRKGQAKADELDKAITQALNATADVAARLNATAAALKAVEHEKTSELLTMVTQLAAEDEREEAKEVKQAAAQAKEDAIRTAAEGHTLGRKEGWGGASARGGGGERGRGAAGAGAGGAAAATAARAPAGGNATANGTATAGVGAKPRQEVREALKQAAAAAATATAAGATGDLTAAAVNVTAMAQAAIDAASTVVASSKASMEEKIEKQKPKVAVRAIEIAKELHAGSSGAGGGAAAASNGTAGAGGSGGGPKTVVIDAAASKHEEVVGGSRAAATAVAAAARRTRP
ncbi:divinyl chlorophyllide a 8-vinyl-chloroplastic isoform A [Micractinium conductrix]|uniref:Divinyl chlorophyllide a 8-vinyl-chloroplastic isoform A n=1 Tax=Micractinium conductrix TaxID=554055 RepID=A0A2P6V6X9_9CHLO|nr:divinyl chlorophyllide a 8-vinyl-chloroplastic isoform A [Micractinium conductrix]|eukprot:PSC69840.1 divinyl chlorophyllide a 8-vinyl-chloroplastic isoform A [Micractinium conductrix]